MNKPRNSLKNYRKEMHVENRFGLIIGGVYGNEKSINGHARSS